MSEDTLLWTYTFAPTSDPERILCVMSNRTHYLWTHCKPGYERDVLLVMLQEAEKE